MSVVQLVSSGVSRVVPFGVQEFGFRRLQDALKVGARVLDFREPELVTGPGSSLELCDRIAATGVRDLLLVTDAVLHELGVIDPIRERLRTRGITVTVFDAVTPDPTVEQVEAGLAELQAQGCTAILAVGGGSPIDAAKVIAARARNPHGVVHMAGLLRVLVPPLPLYAIPTTAGTGSEATIAAVITDAATSHKCVIMDPKLVPRAAALDARLMTGLPAWVTIASGMDALTHAIEAYLSRNATEATDLKALEAVGLIVDHLAVTVREPGDLDARQRMARASYLAGVAFTTASVGWVHAISHNIGALYHLPHGWTNAVILPRILDLYRPIHQTRLAELAVAAGLDPGLSEPALADAFIALVRDLNAEFGIPEHFDALRTEDVPLIAERAMREAHWSYAVPLYFDRPTLEALLRSLGPRPAQASATSRR